MKEELIATLIQTLLPLVATALGTVLVALATYYTTLIRQRIQSESLNKYLDILNTTVIDVVVGLNQTVVDQLKKASEDGHLTPEEVRAVKQDAIDTVTNIIGMAGIEVLKLTFNDVEALIASKIERAVSDEHPPVAIAKLEKAVCSDGLLYKVPNE